ncbi:MAG: phosphoglycerate kinase [Candidatus Pacebacteria bacterium]|nr:phosphoglycerate kinase [Candidatus Paceibacterota bacterium]
MKTLRDFKLQNKRVLLRSDFNVPLGDKGEILDDFRIKATLPTIKYLMENGAKIILMSHLGRPEGKVVEKWKMTPIQDRLMEYLDLSITKAPDCLGSEIEKWTWEMNSGEILLLENLRFHKEEEKNDDDFARSLAKLGDIYVNDAFGASHRAHASIVGVPKYLPSAAGFLLEKEIEVLSKIMENPQKPLVAIVGGAKVETKTELINKISEIAEFVLVGGLINKEIKEKNIKLKHPQKILGPIDEMDEGKDIGTGTIDLFKEKINLAKTIFWNGPLGQIEKEEFSKGTKEIAEAIIKSNVFSVVGGGETVDLINKLGLIEKFNHVSTGGGAMLEFMSGEKLPGIEALK